MWSLKTGSRKNAINIRLTDLCVVRIDHNYGAEKREAWETHGGGDGKWGFVTCVIHSD